MSFLLNPSIHKSILLGLTRAPLTTESLHIEDAEHASETLTHLLQQHAPQQAIWQMIAANHLLQQAGYLPQSFACDTGANFNERNPCPAEAEHVLGLLLRGVQPELLETWLQQAQVHNVYLPYQYIAQLLEAGLRKPDLRQALLPILDQRGQWLVGQNPVWRKCYGIAGDHTHEQWNLGNLAERVQAFTTMRLMDATAALAALQADWRSEAGENRAALLACLAVNISLADEDFLEAGLDDKRKEVRHTAQQLLTQLPEAQWAKRSIERISSQVVFKKKLLGGVVLTVHLPELCDTSMVRDGIGEQKYVGLGEKAGWLCDVVGRIPLNHWSAFSLMPSQKLIAAIIQQEFKQPLILGLIHATTEALKYKPTELAVEYYTALLDVIISGQAEIEAPQSLMQVFRFLPIESQHAIVLGWIDKYGDWSGKNAIISWCQTAANQSTASWSIKLSRRALEQIQAGMLATSRNNWALESALKSFARVLDVTEMTDYDTGWPDSGWAEWPYWRQKIDSFLETLRFRHNIHASFLENNK